jgi:Holliday junction DNA helicase RuvB
MDINPMEAGAAYALYRHGQDEQTNRLLAGLLATQQNEPPVQTPVEVHVHLDEEDPNLPLHNNYTGTEIVDWDNYIGQEPLKRKIMIAIKSAKARGARLDHVLLASGMPGVGKTTMARLIAKQMGVNIFELVPPFNIYTLVRAAETLDDEDILFIDEIHKLADRGKAQAESVLLKVLEDGIAFLPDGEIAILPDITIIGATTDPDKLPEPILDRFKIKPYFQAYNDSELMKITMGFAFRHASDHLVTDDVVVTIADACRATPRVAEEFVLAARDLALALGAPPTSDELLTFMEVTEDGLTRQHVHYLTAMYQYFKREGPKGKGWEYIVGEAAIMQILRETKQGLGRIERFLVERGMIDRTPRGRRLTDRGIIRARQFIAEGKGSSDVA